MITLEDGKGIIGLLKNLNYNQGTALNQGFLSQLFYQSKMVEESLFQPLSQFNEFFKKGILAKDNKKIYSTIRIVPFNQFYFIVDSPAVSSTATAERYFSNKDSLYGYIGGDGMALMDYILPRLNRKIHKKGLDLCAGSGIIGIVLSTLFDWMHAVDIDEYAFKWMQFNAQLNGIKNYTAYKGDLYAPLKASGPFDVIFANPSYSFFPAEVMEKYQIKRHEVADDLGLDLVLKIIGGFNACLAPEGTGYICTSTPVLNGRDYLVQKITEMFSEHDYAFEIYYNSCYTHSEFKKYYNSLGITKFYFVFVKVKKGLTFKIKRVFSKSYYLSQARMIMDSFRGA